MNLFHYRLYGLGIASEIECHGLPCQLASKGIDVDIRYGKVAAVDFKEDRLWGFHVENPQDVILVVRGVGSYRISDGRMIVIERAFEATDPYISLFLLGSAMGVILHQRGLLPLHGNAIIHKEGCVAILGHTGKGKSTLAAAFRKRGYKLLSDDVCALRTRPDAPPTAYPGIPRIKLWDDAVREIGIDQGAIERIVPDMGKYFLPLDEGYSANPTPLKQVYVLSTHNGDRNFLEALTPVDKLRLLRLHTYRTGIIKKMGTAIQHFRMCADVARHVRISMIYRPEKTFLIEELADLIEDDLDS